MLLEQAQTLISKIDSGLEKDGFKSDAIVANLKDLRPFALEEEDPLATKVIRLTYEHIEENGTFQIAVSVDEDEEGNEIAAELADDATNLRYLMGLLSKSQNQFNRDEMREFANIMKNG
jgi:hypothetical protein